MKKAKKFVGGTFYVWAKNYLPNGVGLECTYTKLKEDYYRLKQIVEAPWKCDVCGNYIGNNSAQVDWIRYERK